MQACATETLVQVFSCEFCEISINTFYTGHLWATASESSYWQVSVLCDRTIYLLSVLFVLTLASNVTVLYGKVAFSVLVLSAKKRYSSFLKKVLFSTVSIENVSTGCHIKTCRSLCIWHKYVIREWNLINFENLNKARGNQAASKLSKTQFFPVSIVKQC